MKAARWPDRLLRRDQGAAELELATDGVQRWLWKSRFGAMLIEVQGGEVFVNRQRVEPAAPPGTGADRPGQPGQSR